MHELIKYEGNEEEFKKYNEILNKSFKGTILFHNKKIKNIKEIF